MFFYYHSLILSFQGGDAVKFTLYAGYQTAMLYMGALKEFLFAENFSYRKHSFWSLHQVLLLSFMCLRTINQRKSLLRFGSRTDSRNLQGDDENGPSFAQGTLASATSSVLYEHSLLLFYFILFLFSKKNNW